MNRHAVFSATRPAGNLSRNKEEGTGRAVQENQALDSRTPAASVSNSLVTYRYALQRALMCTLASLMLTCCFAALSVSHATILTVVPSHPEPGDPIHVIATFPLGGCTYSGSIEVVRNGGSITLIHHVVRPVVVSTGTCAESVDLDGLPAGRYHLDWILSVTPNPVVVPVGNVDFVVGDGGPPLAVPGLNWENLMVVSLGIFLIAMFAVRTGSRGHVASPASRWVLRTLPVSTSVRWTKRPIADKLSKGNLSR